MNEKLQEALNKNYAKYLKEIENAEEDYRSLIAQAEIHKQRKIEEAQYRFFDLMEDIQEELKDDMPF